MTQFFTASDLFRGESFGQELFWRATMKHNKFHSLNTWLILGWQFALISASRCCFLAFSGLVSNLPPKKLFKRLLIYLRPINLQSRVFSREKFIFFYFPFSSRRRWSSLWAFEPSESHFSSSLFLSSRWTLSSDCSFSFFLYMARRWVSPVAFYFSSLLTQ